MRMLHVSAPPGFANEPTANLRAQKFRVRKKYEDGARCIHQTFIASPSNSQAEHDNRAPCAGAMCRTYSDDSKGRSMFGLARAGSDLRQGPVVGPGLIFLFATWGLLGCSDYGPPRNTEGLQNLQPVTGSV